MWRNNVSIDVVATNPQFVLTKVRKGKEKIGLVSFVYGSPANHLRNKLWENLSGDKLPLTEEWIALGDYNAVTCLEDVSNRDNFQTHRCAGMRHWVFKEGLIDIGFVGARYTWTRGSDNSTFTGARLDIVLCNLQWITKYPNTKVTHLARVCFDHSPLLVELEPTSESQRRYTVQFQAAWSRLPSFQGMVAKCWEGDTPIMYNISNMQLNCSKWGKEEFGSIKRRKNKLLARIEEIQRHMDHKPRGGLLRLERKLREELEEVLHQEELKWFQKSKEEWILSGDRNTSFYHSATMVRRARGRINGLKNSNDQWIQDSEQIEEMIQGYYKGLYAKERVETDTNGINGLFPKIEDHKWNIVNRTVSMEEVKEAMMGMAPLKALGPDGFHAMFYQKYWSIVGVSMYNLVVDFFSNGNCNTPKF